MKTSILLLAFLFGIAGLQASPDQSLVRVNTTIQKFSVSQPWEKTSPRKRRGLGALLEGNRVITTAEMAADAVYLELESQDRTENIPAKVLAIDYEANLALLAPEKDAGFLSTLKPTSLSGPIKLKSTIDIYQVEDNGMAIKTSGTVQSVDLLSTFVSDAYFLSYIAKASMQSASSSYTLPAFHGGKLVGILTSYNSKDQLCEITAQEILQAFLKDAADGKYDGFPSIGVGYTTTEDTHFRSWLGLTEEQGGLYVSRILPGGSADAAGLKKGDVILKIDGQAIDRRGYYNHADYGTLFWPHLVRGSQPIGKSVPVSIQRDGKEQEIQVALKRPTEPLLPRHLYDKAPPFLIKGGLIFQELSQGYLHAYGKDWESKAPLNLLDVLNNPEDYEEGRRRVVVLTRVIATEATIGYDRIGGRIVTEVNGKKIKGLPELAKILDEETENGIHSIHIDEVPYQLYLDEETSDAVDKQFLQSVPKLSRLYEVTDEPVEVKSDVKEKAEVSPAP